MLQCTLKQYIGSCNNVLYCIIKVLCSPVFQPEQKLFTATADVLSPGQLDSGEDVTELLSTVEDSIRLIGPQLKANRTRRDTNEIGNVSPNSPTLCITHSEKGKNSSPLFFMRCSHESPVQADADIAVQRGRTPPTGPVHLTNDNATLDTDWTIAAGTGSYPGEQLFSFHLYDHKVTLLMLVKLTDVS